VPFIANRFSRRTSAVNARKDQPGERLTSGS
jgi:hypothetical protein